MPNFRSAVSRTQATVREMGDMGIQEFVTKKLVRTLDAEAPV